MAASTGCRTRPIEPRKRIRAAVVADLVRAGWRPPRPSDRIAQQILDDIERIGDDGRRNLQHLDLTASEIRVLVATAHGATAKEIAERFRVSVHTVKSHQKMIRAKLGARSAAHAVALAFQRGIL